jgi:hypothetical protein
MTPQRADTSDTGRDLVIPFGPTGFPIVSLVRAERNGPILVHPFTGQENSCPQFGGALLG